MSMIELSTPVATPPADSQSFSAVRERLVVSPGKLEATSPSKFERQRRLSEWNRTEADFPRDKCLHQMFEEQVAQSPEAMMKPMKPIR